MSWVTDLASTFGLPAGGATIATAMYAACVAAEKIARPEALTDIGRVLKDPTWERSVRPSAIIEQVFNWTFDERHFSWRCVKRSICATTIFVSAFVIIMYFKEGQLPLGNICLGRRYCGVNEIIVLPTILLILVGFLPDYIALWKTRLLLRSFLIKRFALLLVISDVFLSLLIAQLFYFMFLRVEWYIEFTGYNEQMFWASVLDIKSGLLWLILPTEYYDDVFLGIQPKYYVDNIPLLLSTLLTSIWTTLLLLSTTALKLLTPVHRFTAWYFDVEKHPVQAIGIVAGALVMIGSLVWSLVLVVIKANSAHSAFSPAKP
jgi:hypothetical protein